MRKKPVTKEPKTDEELFKDFMQFKKEYDKKKEIESISQSDKPESLLEVVFELAYDYIYAITQKVINIFNRKNYE